ncbi:putative LRR receptor-like serine/threonine-protein kinase MEE39, partial [Cucurbita argyrosperma subsp. sororia]
MKDDVEVPVLASAVGLYCVSGKLTKGSDVYGFGVVLMEIVTGKQAGPIGVDGEYVGFTQWVSSMFGKAQVGSVVDPRLEGNYDVCSVEEALKIAMACSSENTHDRPTMGEVVIKLKHCLQMETARSNQTISGGYT